MTKLLSKEKKELLREIVSRSEQISKLWSELYFSKTKLVILLAISEFESLSKIEIHKILLDAGIDIAYKNTIANIDFLERSGLVNYEKIKLHNTTLVKCNSEAILQHFKKLKTLNEALMNASKKIMENK